LLHFCGNDKSGNKKKQKTKHHTTAATISLKPFCSNVPGIRSGGAAQRSQNLTEINTATNLNNDQDFL